MVLAGTGDPNDATDSYYGSGLLRSADGGLTWTLMQQSHDGVAGNHSFVGLGFAGFAWSSSTPGLVVAAVSQAAEGVLVNAVDATNSVMGLYYSTDAGVTWQMAVIKDGSQVVQTAAAGSEPGGECGDGGGVESGAAAVLCGGAVPRVLPVGRWNDVDAAGASAGDGADDDGLSDQPRVAGSARCPIFRGALAVQAVTGDTFALTVDGNNAGPGNVAGCVRDLERADARRMRSALGRSWRRRRWRWAVEVRRFRRRTITWRWRRWPAGDGHDGCLWGRWIFIAARLAAVAACCAIRRMR